jgi:hypothetical protein
MDGQAEGTGSGYDPSVTSVIAPPGPGIQGSFFVDGSSYRTFADTDKVPIVRGEDRDHRSRGRGRSGGRGRSRRRGRWLGVVVAVLALVVVLAATALGLVQAGVIGNTAGTTNGAAATDSTTPAPSHHTGSSHHNAAKTAHLLTQTSLGAGAATYRVSVPAYGLTITTGIGRAWVSVGSQGQTPIFASVLEAHSSQHFTMLGPTQVEIGAGGTSLTVTSNHKTQTLQPPSAPFTYTLTTS